MKPKKHYEPKPLFLERMKSLLGKEINSYLEFLKKDPQNSIRCNTLKISPDELLKRLKDKGWVVEQPFKDYPEVMVIEGKIAKEKNVSNKVNIYDKNDDSHVKNSRGGAGGKALIPLEPGELGRSLEHVLGYYYVQEISSMLPIIALQPKPGELVLDLAASPGSKTTQAAALMKNHGTIIANDVSLGRIKILASNTERCGASNIIITKKEGAALCIKLKQAGFQFDKILIDAPCSGEGTFRSAPRGMKMWNIHTVKKLSKLQKYLVANAWEILKPNGELVYSTCTHAPEENEEIVDFMLNKFKDEIKVEQIKLPIICRQGLNKWQDKTYKSEVQKACRIYPQDNDTEGFFIAKFMKVR